MRPAPGENGCGDGAGDDAVDDAGDDAGDDGSLLRPDEMTLVIKEKE